MSINYLHKGDDDDDDDDDDNNNIHQYCCFHSTSCSSHCGYLLNISLSWSLSHMCNANLPLMLCYTQCDSESVTVSPRVFVKLQCSSGKALIHPRFTWLKLSVIDILQGHICEMSCKVSTGNTLGNSDPAAQCHIPGDLNLELYLELYTLVV